MLELLARRLLSLRIVVSGAVRFTCCQLGQCEQTQTLPLGVK